jgi:predicted amidohydrolase YtcJ
MPGASESHVRADLLIRAGAVHTMVAGEPALRAVAVRGGRIWATGREPGSLDALAGPATRVLDLPGWTLLPAFEDSHEHLFEVARNMSFVQVDQARSIDEFVALVRERAQRTAPGQWIETTMAWNEANLAEQRLPTRDDLDRATTDHPVYVRRGGHVVVGNTRALAAAGFDDDSPDPERGKLGRLPDGRLSGLLQGSANIAMKQQVPPLDTDTTVAALEKASRTYAALGYATVREALIFPPELLVYRTARDRGALKVRVRPMLWVPRTGPIPERIEAVRRFRDLCGGDGDDMLRVWGLKIVFDGGVANAAFDQPYADDPTWSGELYWDPDDLAQVVEAAVREGWRVGTHAVGDRTVRTLLDVYQKVLADHPHLPAGTLVIEHAMITPPEQRARAARLGVWITMQHKLFDRLGAETVRRWGPERVEQVNAVRGWLDDGAVVAAGSDAVEPTNPLYTLWGFATRQVTGVGRPGLDQAITVAEGLRLHTVEAARVCGEAQLRGTLAPGRLADLVAYTTDPLTAPLEALPEMTPELTLVGGHPAHDPTGLLGTP